MKLTNEKKCELDTLVLKLATRLSKVSYVEDVLKKSGLLQCHTAGNRNGDRIPDFFHYGSPVKSSSDGGLHS